jgi:hypothetical protein
MGMLDCVAGSEEEYVALAVRLGTDRTYREAIRAKILASNSVLYRNEAAVREFEQFVCSTIAGDGIPSGQPAQRVPTQRPEEGDRIESGE